VSFVYNVIYVIFYYISPNDIYECYLNYAITDKVYVMSGKHSG